MAPELQTEQATLQRIKSGKLVEGLEHMSPTYLEGIKRILTVSADTELISAPAYFRAAQDAPSLNAFGTAISIVQDELAHAHIAHRLLEHLGADKDWLVYQRPAGCCCSPSSGPACPAPKNGTPSSSTMASRAAAMTRCARCG